MLGIVEVDNRRVGEKGEEQTWKGVSRKSRIRIFEENPCICCMGGNCYILGHVGSCQCLCILRKSRTRGIEFALAWKEAIAFKIGFVPEERYLRGKWQSSTLSQGKRRLISLVLTRQLQWDARARWERWQQDMESRLKGGPVKGRWEDYLEKQETAERGCRCRRFIVKRNGVIRQEDNCLRPDCPHCSSSIPQLLKDVGDCPFTPFTQQLRWICEFFSGVVIRNLHQNSRTREHPTSGINEVYGIYKHRRVLGQIEWTIDRERGRFPRDRCPITEEAETYGTISNPFPTIRRPQMFRRSVDTHTPSVVCRNFVSSCRILLGDHLIESQHTAICRLLYTWKDVFVTEYNQLPVTDLFVHAIPTYEGARPHRDREAPVTPEEHAWQINNIPLLLGTIISFTSSPWVAKTTFVPKKDSVQSIDPISGFRTSMRMVHTYCALNNVTIKTNYPMKRMEPIINGLAKSSRRFYFSGDASNGYWAVPLLAEHAYKTAFNTVMGQCCYLRMGMGLTGAPHTYACLKDITFGPIPTLFPEQSLHEVVADLGGVIDFRYFFDDNYGAADDFDILYHFLANWYFPRLAWANLTLKPSKTAFMVLRIEPLGLEVGRHELEQGRVAYGVKASRSKLEKLRDYPTPQSIEEVEKFLQLTLYLKPLIPGRAEHARILKTANQFKIQEVIIGGVKKKKKVRRGFIWSLEDQKSFDAIKHAVMWNICMGSDDRKHHYMAMDTSPYGFGAILFQLEGDEDRQKIPKGEEKVIHYISQRFSDTETRYAVLEREALTVLRSLEEIRWMAVSSRFPIVVFTDKQALRAVLKGNEVKGRIAGWQARLAEYNLHIRHVKSTVVELATGLSRMPYDLMDNPKYQDNECADTLAVLTEINTMDKRSSPSLELMERVFYPPIHWDGHLRFEPNIGTVVDNTGLMIWCDGACKGNGTASARSSIGLYLGPGHEANEGQLVPPDYPQTNQTAELWAVNQALRLGRHLAQKHGLTQIVIASDSEYVCAGLTKWVEQWRRNDFSNVHNGMFFHHLDTTIDEIKLESGIQTKLWKIKREFNQFADALAKGVLYGKDNAMSENEVVKEQAMRWKAFLVDPWYGEAVWYKLYGTLTTDSKNARRERKVKREASNLILWDEGPVPKLGRYESDGSLAECIRSHQVAIILHRFHDHHGHSAPGIMSRNLLGRYYWPGRFKDVIRWCRTCDACQKLGPLQRSSTFAPIMQLQPMDMLGIDFIGPFTPMSEGEGKYIIIAVDYFSRYLWARVTTSNHGHIVASFLEKDVVRWFRWPLAVYSDNGSHFVKGVIPPLLASHGVKLFSAPITHPRSVGLSERYVQLVLAGLRSKVLSDSRPKALVLWHEHLAEVVHAINTCVLRVHGYTPSQLLMGFNARWDTYDQSLMDEAMKEILQRVFNSDTELTPDQRAYDVRIAQIEEMRELAREQVFQHQEELVISYKKGRYHTPRVGDLVLLRQFVIDKEKGRKLEARWEGPYRLDRIGKEGISGHIQDLKTGKIKGRYGFDHLRVYLRREDQSAPVDGDIVALDVGLASLCEGWYMGRSVDLYIWACSVSLSY